MNALRALMMMLAGAGAVADEAIHKPHYLKCIGNTIEMNECASETTELTNAVATALERMYDDGMQFPERETAYREMRTAWREWERRECTFEAVDPGPPCNRTTDWIEALSQDVTGRWIKRAVSPKLDDAAQQALHEKLVRADAALNSTYKDLLPLLGDDRRRLLRDASRAWIRYRDLRCAWHLSSFSFTYGDGGLRELCLLEATEDRLEWLRGQLDWFSSHPAE